MNRIVVKLLTLVMIIGCSMCTTNNLQAEFNKNFQLVSQWRCGTPKPRLVYLEEALGGPPIIQPDTHWIVKAAVLHRCHHDLGCCDPPKTCKKTSSTTVLITFRAMNMLTRNITYPQLQFTNHTTCGCLSPND